MFVLISLKEKSHLIYSFLFLGLAVCLSPAVPLNGQISPSNRFIWRSGDVVTYSCDEDYFLMGSSSATCQDDRTFDNRAPRCICMNYSFYE